MTIFLERGALRFQICTDSMIRVLYSAQHEFPRVAECVVIKSAWPKTPAYRELYGRWFEFGAFCPIFRAHGTRTTNQNEIWSYGSQMQAILARYDRLRYRLLPYIYSVARKTTSENYTQMRALAMDFRDDPRVLNIGDPFLFGPSLLVNPVTEPGAATRHLYLPKDNWYNFWTSESVKGGRAIDTPAPLEEMPIFLRAGAILPMGPNIEYAQQPSNNPLQFRVYAGAYGDFTLTKKRATRMTMRKAPLQRFRFIGMRRGID